MQTGEGPIWDPRNKVLYCVDSTNLAIWAFSQEGRVIDWMSLPERIGFVVLTNVCGVLVVGLKSGLFRVDLATRALLFLLGPEPGRAFGGDDLRTLYMTSANRGIDPGFEPLAGSVFRIETKFTGIAARPLGVQFSSQT